MNEVKRVGGAELSNEDLREYDKVISKAVEAGEHDDEIGTTGRQEGRAVVETQEIEEPQPNVDPEGHAIVDETAENDKDGNVKGVVSGRENVEEDELAA